MSVAALKIEGATLQSLLLLVKTHTGITMEERKRDLLFSRLNPRMRVLSLETMEQYVDFLQKNSSEVQEFVNAVTTNETLFFRTPVIWDYYKDEFLPQWFAQHPQEVLKIWSAASSSGEEAYSLAILCEEFKMTHPTFRYRIYGTDISTEVLEDAKRGVFKEKSLEAFKAKFPQYFSKYFKAHATKGTKAAEVLIVNTEFSIHNLHKRPAKIQFYDIVFLRNVLIYFSDADQELVLRNIHAATKPAGVLIVGESESLGRLKTEFSFHKPLIYKKGSL